MQKNAYNELERCIFACAIIRLHLMNRNWIDKRLLNDRANAFLLFFYTGANELKEMVITVNFVINVISFFSW